MKGFDKKKRPQPKYLAGGSPCLELIALSLKILSDREGESAKCVKHNNLGLQGLSQVDEKSLEFSWNLWLHFSKSSQYCFANSGHVQKGAWTSGPNSMLKTHLKACNTDCYNIPFVLNFALFQSPYQVDLHDAGPAGFELLTKAITHLRDASGRTRFH